MTPEGRLSAAIDLLHEVLDQPRRPADAISADFFRARRYIGGSDRRAVSDLAWGVLRQLQQNAVRRGDGKDPAEGRRPAHRDRATGGGGLHRAARHEGRERGTAAECPR